MNESEEPNKQCLHDNETQTMETQTAPAFRIPEAVRSSVHDGGLILFQTESGTIYSAGRTGATIWEIIQQGGSESQAADALRQRFGARPEEAERGTASFVTMLESRGFLIRREEVRPALFGWWVARAIWECARYDLLYTVFGFRAVHRSLELTKVAGRHWKPDAEDMVSRATSWALSLYFRPLRCLARSVISVRLLRLHGVPAQVVVGYAPTPFSSHAWVEVAGRVVGGTTSCSVNMTILDRF